MKTITKTILIGLLALVGLSNAANAQVVAAGINHSLAVCSDGTVQAWGNIPGTGNSTTPMSMSGLSGIIAIAGGNYYSVALKNDGTVWTWGFNLLGSLGNGTAMYALSPTPAQVTGLTGVTAIAGGYNYFLAVKNDGTVWTCAQNKVTQVPGLSGITAVSGGYDHYLALKNDGTVWSWGNNAYGQLGGGGSTSAIPGLTGVTAIAAGFWFSVALKSDGTVWSWGYNNQGQLGDSTIIDKKTPVQVKGGLTGITAIGVGGGAQHVLALKNDGTVWAWGRNSELQVSGSPSKNVPVQVTPLSSIVAVAGNGYSSFALKNDGTVWAWGKNDQGQIGDGTTSGAYPKYPPVQPKGLCKVSITTTVTVPTAPSNLTLTPQKTNTTGDMMLGWTDNASNEVGFYIERGTDGTTFTKIDSTLANIATYTDKKGVAATKYYYRVSAYNSAGSSAYSNTVNGTTLTGINDISVNNVVAIYPNPSKGKFTIRMENVKGNGSATLTTRMAVYNVLGERVYTATHLQITKLSNYQIDLSALPAGIYFLQVNTGEGIVNRKLVLEK